MSERIQLELKDHYVVVETEKNQSKEEKKISYRSLENLFQTNRSTFQTPLLPGEFGLQKLATKGDRSVYFYLEEPRALTVQYRTYKPTEFRTDYFTDEQWGITQDEDESREDFEERLRAVFQTKTRHGNLYTHFFKFVIPRTLWTIHVRTAGDSFQVLGSFVHAMRTSILTEKEMLYSAPFSNVYSDHKICWGQNTLNLPSAKAIQGVSTLFFNAPFNSDLDSSRFSDFYHKQTDGDNEKYVSSFFDLLEVVDGLIREGNDLKDALHFVESKLLQTPQSVESHFTYHRNLL